MNDWSKYTARQMQAIKADAMEYVMRLYDAPALNSNTSFHLPSGQPGVPCALENDWIEGKDGFYWLTGKGVNLAFELCNERSKFFMRMANKYCDQV